MNILTFDQFKEKVHINFSDDLKKDLKSLYALDSASELDELCKTMYNEYIDKNQMLLASASASDLMEYRKMGDFK